MNREHRCELARWAGALVAIGVVSFGGGCGSGDAEDSPTEQVGVPEIVPVFEDANANGVNDHEFDGHVGGATSHARAESAGPDHDFVDENGDFVCDFAQDGSRTWHGPGFLDSDNDGICDYWDADRPEFNQHGGLLYRDRNSDGLNDFWQGATHEGNGHDFVDENTDGLCDVAQSGRLDSWHGPNFVDEDDDGVCDLWEEGGRAHGGGRHHRGGSDTTGPDAH